MKRLMFAMFTAGLLTLSLSPKSADAGILSRIFGRSQGSTATVPAGNANTEAGRRYSYEPSMSGSSNSTVLRGQSHLLPKTDPRRYIPN